jgi:hypothetical protein
MRDRRSEPDSLGARRTMVFRPDAGYCDVSQPKGKKLHCVEPTLVQSTIVDDGIGYLKVAMFPGMIGVDVANEISKAVAVVSAQLEG